jgi:large subunit ribosomal protein L6
MSRIGKNPIKVPKEIQVIQEGSNYIFKGPKGELSLSINKKVDINLGEEEIEVKPKDLKVPETKALWGTYRALITNCILGVSQGFQKKLEINGTGYNATLNGKKLVLKLGYSHPIEMETPDGITFEVEKNLITVSGIDKQKVGQIAAEIRSKRKVEPYKGKGIKYEDELVRRKVGKKAAGEGS